MLGTSVTSNGQVTVPKEVRAALGIRTGDTVYFVADRDRAIMVPLKGDIWSVRGALQKYAKKKSWDWKKVRQEVRKWRGARQSIRPEGA